MSRVAKTSKRTPEKSWRRRSKRRTFVRQRIVRHHSGGTDEGESLDQHVREERPSKPAEDVQLAIEDFDAPDD
jgi:hypothetical protein